MRCGKSFPYNGKPSECNPFGERPCCSPSGWCGKSAGHCICDGCTNYADKIGELKIKGIFAASLRQISLRFSSKWFQICFLDHGLIPTIKKKHGVMICGVWNHFLSMANLLNAIQMTTFLSATLVLRTNVGGLQLMAALKLMSSVCPCVRLSQ